MPPLWEDPHPALCPRGEAWGGFAVGLLTGVLGALAVGLLGTGPGWWFGWLDGEAPCWWVPWGVVGAVGAGSLAGWGRGPGRDPPGGQGRGHGMQVVGSGFDHPSGEGGGEEEGPREESWGFWANGSFTTVGGKGQMQAYLRSGASDPSAPLPDLPSEGREGPAAGEAFRLGILFAEPLVATKRRVTPQGHEAYMCSVRQLGVGAEVDALLEA
jgi:hypothetical protein